MWGTRFCGLDLRNCRERKGSLRCHNVALYVIQRMSDVNTMEIWLQNEDDAEVIKVDVDQLSRCFPEFEG